MPAEGRTKKLIEFLVEKTLTPDDENKLQEILGRLHTVSRALHIFSMIETGGVTPSRDNRHLADAHIYRHFGQVI